jgi:hypothetical protein
MIWVLAFPCWHCCRIWRKIPIWGNLRGKLGRNKNVLNSSETACDNRVEENGKYAETFFLENIVIFFTF